MNVLKSRLQTLGRSIKNIQTFRQIPSVLNPLPQLNKNELEQLKNEVHFTQSESLKRVLIYQDNIMDGFVIFWKQNSKSPVHNHASEGCYFRPLYEGLQEHKYTDYDDYIVLTETRKLPYCNTQYIDDVIGFHSIENTTDMIIPSIHFYSPSGHKTEYLNEYVKGF